MEDKYYSELVLIRMERAAELLKDAEELLINGSYKLSLIHISEPTRLL